MITLTMAATALALLSAPPARADDPNCKDPQTQVAMTMCARQAYEAAEQRLNVAYAAARKRASALDDRLRKLGPHHFGVETALIEGQFGWIAYRDGHCAVKGFSARCGTMEPTLVSSCLADMTEKRSTDLEAIIKQ